MPEFELPDYTMLEQIHAIAESITPDSVELIWKSQMIKLLEIYFKARVKHINSSTEGFSSFPEVLTDQIELNFLMEEIKWTLEKETESGFPSEEDLKHWNKFKAIEDSLRELCRLNGIEYKRPF